MARKKKFRSNCVESRQGLLPGIPDEITMKYIASKFKWKTCNVMETVSREWQHAIRNRTVYDARVSSNSTEAFLVVAYFFNGCNKRRLTLYSCIDDTFLHLPPIPGATDTTNHPYFECICLDGRIYLWEPADSFKEPSVLWVLDLVGDKRWTMRERVKCSRIVDQFKIGVLDGKIYRFRGTTRPDRRVLETSAKDYRQSAYQQPWVNIWSQMLSLPQTEVYDLHSNVWSNITPEPPLHLERITPKRPLDHRQQYLTASLEWERFEHHLTVFFEWEKEQLQTDASTTIRRYEPFYSEWRAWHSMTLAVEKGWCRRHPLATQVYDTNYIVGVKDSTITEKFFFSQERLVKVVEHRRYREFLGLDIEAYDTEKEAWKVWKYVPPPDACRDRPWVGSVSNTCGIHSCVFVDNVMWALTSVVCLDHFNSVVCLMRRPVMFDGGASGDSAGWIHTGCSMVHFNPNNSELRPIYL